MFERILITPRRFLIHLKARNITGFWMFQEIVIFKDFSLFRISYSENGKCDWYEINVLPTVFSRLHFAPAYSTVGVFSHKLNVPPHKCSLIFRNPICSLCHLIWHIPQQKYFPKTFCPHNRKNVSGANVLFVGERLVTSIVLLPFHSCNKDSQEAPVQQDPWSKLWAYFL